LIIYILFGQQKEIQREEVPRCTNYVSY